MSGDVNTPSDTTSDRTSGQFGRSQSTAPGPKHILRTIIGRELRTIVRTRTFFILALAFAAVVLGISSVSGSVQGG